MVKNRIIPFVVTSVDSLGQGVSKVTEKITFIAKTAVGDEGEAEIISEKKGVSFARVKILHKSSAQRVPPSCLHYGQCPSCHFLHISYEEELKIKKQSFEYLMRKMELPTVQVVGAPERLSYRNRIQLHYSLKSKLIGMRDPLTQAIHPIPQCRIGKDQVTKEMARLYHQDQWLKEAPKIPAEGHVEIYAHDNQLKTSWNRPYAEGGFTQVNESMNQLLKSALMKELKSMQGVLDLFGGNGNLSENLHYSKRLCVDLYGKLPGTDFFSQDLYLDSALSRVLHELKIRSLQVSHLLIDPPRSGLKNLNQWAQHLRPEQIIYVSCDPHTLARDVQALTDYDIKKAYVFDFFPSTFHFESLLILDRKGSN
jgi:23S rRNA (uracil1939-C5)-methyltransferase